MGSRVPARPPLSQGGRPVRYLLPMRESLTVENPAMAVPPKAAESFSLLQGGPIYRFLRLLNLTAPNPKRIWIAFPAAVALTWIPLLACSIVSGDAAGARVKIPFLFDFWTNTRFLVTLPVLMVAESLIDARIRHAADHFVDAGLVTEDCLPAYRALLGKLVRLRDSPVAGLLLMILAIAGPIWLNQTKLITKELSSWQFQTAGEKLTPAGWWLTLVSNPLYRLALIRWLWVLVVWTVFLKHVVRLPLRFSPSHPDKAGGLGFLGHTQLFFGALTFALSAAVAGGFANLLTYEGSSIMALRFGIVAFCVAAIAVLAIPLLFLAPRLFQIKQQGLNDYGVLACEYTRDFDQKWLRRGRRASTALLGTPDLQSLSDLNQSYAVVKEMKILMIDRHILLGLAIPPIVPMLALAISTVPLDAIIKAVLRLLA